MRMRPSRVEKMLARAPEDLQRAALKAIAEERARIGRGDFTEEERAGIVFARQCGAAAALHASELMAGVAALQAVTVGSVTTEGTEGAENGKDQDAAT